MPLAEISGIRARVAVMEKRTVGQTGLQVSRLGLGTLTWGRDTQQEDAKQLLRAFCEAGGTLIDTASPAP